nr:PQQ-binding-like beta-propeller repeat protein [Candidatus Njordarchaeum guaymaensis]
MTKVKRTGKVAAIAIMTMVLITALQIIPQQATQQNKPNPTNETKPRITTNHAPPTPQSEWNYTTGSDVHSSPCVADVDGDSQLEVLVGSADNKLYCLGGTGGLEWSYTTGESIHSSPCVADVDGDSQLEVLVGSYDHKVYCLSVVGAPFNVGAYPWPSICFHGDIRHSGCYVDSDHDGLMNGYEVTGGANPLIVDPDTDGFTDYEEFLASTNPLLDGVPPAAITDLLATKPTANTITLTWTAPGDNGNGGNATGYEVRYSTAGHITDANWSTAATCSQSWIPAKNGTAETHVIFDLSSSTTYWFAIKAYDKATNYGAISNSISATTTAQSGGGGELLVLLVAAAGIAAVAILVVIAVVKMKK